MLKYLSKLALVVTMGCAFSMPLSAATVAFTSGAPTFSTVTCIPGPGEAGSNCNYAFAEISGGFGGTVNEAGSVFKLFDVRAQAPADELGGDSFTFTTTVNLLIGSTNYLFSALATLSNWNPTNSGSNGLNGSAALTWSNVTSALGAPVAVSFLTDGPFDGRGRERIAQILVRAVETSVVPLPGGILLLGSALLGIFGLSRRRNRKLAAA